MNQILSLTEWQAWAKAFPVRAAADAPYVSPLKLIKAAKKGDRHEILIYGAIGRDLMGDDGLAAKEFAQMLAEIPKGERPLLRISSPGGNVFDGFAIYNLAASRGVDVVVDSVAASIAAVIMCAGQDVSIPDSSSVMIHKCWGLFVGNADDVGEFRSQLDKHDDLQAGVFAKKTGRPASEIKASMSKDRWFSAREAKEFGFSNSTILAAAGDTQKTPEQLPAATAITSAPQAGATNQPQQGQKMRDTYIALLNEWGVKFEASATDADLKALVTAGKPQAKPAVDPAAAELARIRAQLDKQQRYAVALELDRLILDNKLTVAEREAEMTLCLADETRIPNVLAKRTAVLPGASPILGQLAYGSEGAFDHVMKLKDARERYGHLRDNWDTLKAAGFRRPGAGNFRQGMPQAANTTDSDLVTQMLVDGATTVLQNRLAPLRAFAKEFAPDPIKPLAVLQHRKITAGGTAQTNATNFEDTTNFIGTEVNTQITMAQITSGGHVTNAERQNGVTMAQWIDIKTAEIGDAIMATVAAVILEGTFTATPLVSSAIGFGGAELAKLWGQLKKSSIHNIILDGEYYAQFLPTDRFGFDVTEYRNRGWDNFLLNTKWTGATANTVGFACNPQAIVVGIGSPLRSIRADAVSSQTKLTLPGLGVTVDVNEWYSNITRNDWTTYDVMFGAASNDATAGVLIKSA